MRRIVLSLVFIFVLFGLKAQVSQHIVKFNIKDRSELAKLPHYVSVDKVKGNTVVAYLPTDEAFDSFKKLYPDLIELPKPGANLTQKAMAYTIDELTANWDKYPTYDVYVQMMELYAQQYPELCRLDTIGQSQQGRLLLVLKITDNPDKKEFEPEFFYTSTMHGDEVTGYMFLLRFIGYLLSNYGVDPNVTYLVNNYEIYINPLANPDGTYAGGNNDISGATRFLANGVDPNRNFYPQPDGSSPEDPEALETTEMKQFASEHNFVMSANLHGGAEVYNYPWDVWTSGSHPHPDDSWFHTIGLRFVDSARKYNSEYFTDPYDSGVTEGGDWYVISGGRQDYMNFVHHCKEVTLEVSSTKLPASSTMPTYYQYLLSPMFWYITESTNGIQGIVLDENGNPLRRRIVLSGHDVIADSSFVLSRNEDGVFFRPILPGTYTVEVQHLDGTVDYSQSVSVGSGRTFVMFAPDNLDSISVIVKTQNIKTFRVMPNVQVHIQGMTNDYDQVLTTDDNGLLTLNLYPGIYKMTTNEGMSPFSIENYVAVYNGMDTVILQKFELANVYVNLTDYFTSDPVQDATVIYSYAGNNFTTQTDASGQATLENIMVGGNYHLIFTKSGYYQGSADIVIDSANQEFNFIMYPNVNVSITVIDSNAMAPISGVGIELYQNSVLVTSYSTNDDGTASFILPSFDTYTAKIIVPGVDPIYRQIEPVATVINDTVYVKRTYAKVTVIDGHENTPVSGAVVAKGSTQYVTNDQGFVIIPAVSTDSIHLVVSASDYYGTEIDVVPSVDTSENEAIIFPHVYFNFTVVDSVTQNPLWAASVVVTIDESHHLSYFTNSSGYVQVFWPSFAPYEVTFSKLHYITKTLTFDPANYKSMEIDETIELAPENLPAGLTDQSAMLLYPNPAESEVNINGQFDKVKIFDLTGKMLKLVELNGKQSFDVSDLGPGVYMIQLIGNDAVVTAKLLKK